MLKMKCHVIDALETTGGQCAALYPEKPIYDIPGFPVVTGQALTDNLMAQIAPFAPEFHFNRMVNTIEKLDDGSFRLVTDADEVFHAKVVVIAAGGGSFQPKRPPVEGIEAYENKSVFYAVRKMDDFRDQDVVIVGGGLLGIELAASLREVNVEVTVIQRISRLMDRQLDPLGSQLLHEELTDKGIDIYYNDEIERFLGSQRIEGIRLKSGLMINCQAIVMAIGTVPNIELARASGIECKRGVVVDEYLRTNDPNVFAVGEIAEFKGFLYGITAAAEQQAEIEPLIAMGEGVLADGDAPRAVSIFRQIHNMAPDNPAVIGGLARALLAAGQPDEARAVVDSAPDDAANHAEVGRARAALELSQAAPAADTSALQSRVASNPAISKPVTSLRAPAWPPAIAIRRRTRSFTSSSATGTGMTAPRASGCFS